MSRSLFLRAATVCLWAAAGCSSQSGQPGPAGPTPVTVSIPIRREVTDYAEFTGVTAAVDLVQIRARVSGYLDSIDFKDGAEVTEGTVLYLIDPRPYVDQLNIAEAQLASNQAAYELAASNFRRAYSLWTEKPPRGITGAEYDQDKAAKEQAKANVDSAQANAAQARLNLLWTKVRAPINGELSRTFITRGNLITAGSTLLTTIASQDPMYAYFDVDEPTVLRVRQLIREGEFQTPEGTTHWPVFLGLANETGYPHEGYVDFSNNQFSPGTATLQVRGVFVNPKPKIGKRLLAPGLFVRIRVPVSPPHEALLISQDAIGANLNVKFVYVVNAQDTVEIRVVELGGTHDGLRSVKKGLKPDDRVIVNGIQHVKAGTVVAAKMAPMPIPGKVEAAPMVPAVTPLPRPSKNRK